jgi:hypothetical protein
MKLGFLTKRRITGMADKPWEVLDQVKEAARRIREQYPDKESDVQKAARAIAGFELGYLPLKRAYGRASALQILDPNKNQTPMFAVSERHIRRVETIRKKRPLDCAFLEGIALRGLLSLELVEWVVNHPLTADVMEGFWLAADDTVQVEFVRRLGLRKE